MTKNDQTVTVKWEQNGQTRPYGPTERIFQLTFGIEGKWGWTPPEQVVKLFAQAVIGHDIHEKDDDWEWWMEYYKSVDQVGKGVWRIHVYQEYLD